ncbi:MAG: sel1 repeat family protein [Robiginitomaculum sp.]|nr:sel1 repeat family protein [Robiginitomaculum sp.]
MKFTLGITTALFYIFTSMPALAGDPVFDAYDAYERGEYKKAYTGFLPIAQAGNNDVQYLVGYLYFEGQGVAQSYHNAATWFTKAADGGNVTAMLTMGEMYETDRLGPNMQEAMRWYKMAANIGNKLGQTKYDALKAKQDALQVAGRTKADGFYDQPTVQPQQQPKIIGSFADGMAAFQAKDIPKTIAILEPLAANNDTNAQEALVLIFYNDKNGFQDKHKALKWGIAAANEGRMSAMKTIAKIYANGETGVKNETLALKWYQKASDAGDKDATYQLDRLKVKLQRLKSSGAENKTAMPVPAVALGSPYSPKTLTTRVKNLANLSNTRITQEFNSGQYAKVRKEASYFAEHGMVDYQLITGKTYFMEKDYSEAMRWYKRAAAAKSGVVADIYITEAQYLVGAMYDYGLGVPEDRNLAAGWYALASNHLLPDKKAAFELGLMYELGEHIPQDDDKAISYYTKAGRENGDALFRIGFLYEKNIAKNFMHKRFALEFYEKSAATGNPLGQFALGVVYSEGKLTSQSYPKAIEWLEKSAAQDNPDAQHNLAMLYANGQGVTQSYEKAFKLLEKAAWQDFTISQYALGIYYSQGKGVEQSETMARFWLKKAAKLGDKPAQEMLRNIGETW